MVPRLLPKLADEPWTLRTAVSQARVKGVQHFPLMRTQIQNKMLTIGIELWSNKQSSAKLIYQDESFADSLEL